MSSYLKSSLEMTVHLGKLWSNQICSSSLQSIGSNAYITLELM